MRAYSPGGTLIAFASAPTLLSGHPVYIVDCADYQGISSCLLPAPSYLSVNHLLAACLRHWYSSRYLQISPLHLEFWLPLSDSSPAVSNAVPGLSPGISHQTCRTAYIPFTPNNSEQRSQLTCYRGCWHVISRCLFMTYSHHEAFPSLHLFLSHKRILQPSGLHHPRGVAPSDFRPLRNILSCCLP